MHEGCRAKPGRSAVSAVLVCLKHPLVAFISWHLGNWCLKKKRKYSPLPQILLGIKNRRDRKERAEPSRLRDVASSCFKAGLQSAAVLWVGCGCTGTCVHLQRRCSEQASLTSSLPVSFSRSLPPSEWQPWGPPSSDAFAGVQHLPKKWGNWL